MKAMDSMKDRIQNAGKWLQDHFFMRGVKQPQQSPAPMRAEQAAANRQQPQTQAAPMQGRVQSAQQPVQSQPVQQPRQYMNNQEDPRRSQQGSVTHVDTWQGNEAKQEEEKPALSLMVMTVTGINDCYRAINLVRGGNALAVTMEGIRDQSEMRRMVDMLSGAAYSLQCSITMLSRAGVYVLSPAALPVRMDMNISRMNNVQVAEPQPQPQPQPQQQTGTGYQPNQYQAPVYQPVMTQQRSVAQQSAAQTFYSSPVQRTVPEMQFAAQEPSSGYVATGYEQAANQ